MTTPPQPPSPVPGFAAAAQPPAGTTIHTGEAGIVAGWATVADGAALLPVYFAKPPGAGRFPVILVIQEVFGVHEHIADVARRLAHLGYLAVAPDLFFRQGDARRAPDIDTLRRDFVAHTGDAQVIGDLERAASWAVGQGGDGGRMGITGFCWGGRIAWLYAAHLSAVNPARLRAAVAWYGRLSGDATALMPRHPLDVARGITIPVLGLYGGQDQGIPLDRVEAMRAVLREAGGRAEIVVYPEAPHAFFADYRSSYRAAAAADGWGRMLAWFQQHGVR